MHVVPPAEHPVDDAGSEVDSNPEEYTIDYVEYLQALVRLSKLRALRLLKLATHARSIRNHPRKSA
jgi:hypothetical protein